MNPRHKGNLAVARAIGYFSSLGNYVFTPIGDNGGAVDLIISVDAHKLVRVQCKFTSSRHRASVVAKTLEPVWQVDLRQIKTVHQGNPKMFYSNNSFDLLFVTTPAGDYVIDWPAFCAECVRKGRSIATLRLGKRNARFKINLPNIGTAEVHLGLSSGVLTNLALLGQGS